MNNMHIRDMLIALKMCGEEKGQSATKAGLEWKMSEIEVLKHSWVVFHIIKQKKKKFYFTNAYGGFPSL